MLKALSERTLEEAEDGHPTTDRVGGQTATEANIPATEADSSDDDEPIPKSMRTGVDFKLAPNSLLYHVGKDTGQRRLCISSSVEQEVFELAHDQNHYAGVHRCYSRIADSLFIPRLSRKL